MIRPTDQQVIDSHDDDEPNLGVGMHGIRRGRFEDRPTYDVVETAAQFRAHFEGLTPAELLLAGAAAVDDHEVDQVALLSLLLFDHITCLTPIELPDGRQVASLHAHLAHWRSRPGGFVHTETLASGPMTRGREPLHI